MDEEIIYSEKLACPDCNLSFEELSPRIFSFNAPYGACENAAGLVWILKLILIWLFLISQKSIKDGAIYPWSKSSTGYYDDVINAVSAEYKIDLNIPFEELSEEHQKIILYGF